MDTETTTTDEPLMTAPQVAAYLQLNVNFVYDAAKRGIIPSMMLGAAHRRFRRSQIDAWLAETQAA